MATSGSVEIIHEDAMDEDLPSHEILRENLTRKRRKTVKSHFTEPKCHECGKIFREKASLDHHVQTHNKVSPFPCRQCTYRAKTKKYLTRHVKRVHSQLVKKNVCGYCGKGFLYKSGLEKHERVHTGAKPYECEECGKAFSSRYSWRTHKLIHTDEKPFRCPYCEYACRDNSTLRRHKDRHAGRLKMHDCEICARRFDSTSKLSIHVREVHAEPDARRHPCPLCSSAFKKQSQLRRHVETVHERSRTCECPVCGVTLSSHYNLKSHLVRHVDKRPYKCSYYSCTSAFKEKQALKKHSRIHDMSQHVICDACGKTFSRKNRLAKHLMQHQPRGKLEECTLCGVKFYTKQYLKKHIKQKHGRDRPKYICDMCDFLTYNKPSIVMHIKHGHDLGKGKCKICSKPYKRNVHLRLHYWNTHGIRFKTNARMNVIPEVVSVKQEPLELVPDVELDMLEVEKEEPFAGFESTEYKSLTSSYPRSNENTLQQFLRQVIHDNALGFDTDKSAEKEDTSPIIGKINKQQTTLEQFTHKTYNEAQETTAENITKQNSITTGLEEVQETSKGNEDRSTLDLIEGLELSDAKEVEASIDNALGVQQKSIVTLEVERTSADGPIEVQQTFIANEAKSTYVDDLIEAKRTSIKVKSTFTPDNMTENIIDKHYCPKLKEHDEKENCSDLEITSKLNQTSSKEKRHSSVVETSEYFVQQQKPTEVIQESLEDVIRDLNQLLTPETEVVQFRQEPKCSVLDVIKQSMAEEDTQSQELTSINVAKEAKGKVVNEELTTKEGVVHQKQSDEVIHVQNPVINVTQTRSTFVNVIQDANEVVMNEQQTSKESVIRRKQAEKVTHVEKHDAKVTQLQDTAANSIIHAQYTTDEVRQEEEYNEDEVKQTSSDEVVHSDCMDVDEFIQQVISGVDDVTPETQDNVIAIVDTEAEQAVQKRVREQLRKMKRSDSGVPGSLKPRGGRIQVLTPEELENLKNRKRPERKPKKQKEEEIEKEEVNEKEVKTDKPKKEIPRSLKHLWNMHQCYICFKLFETKPKLIEHCKEHFDICNEITLKKCPLCSYVTKKDIKRHVRQMHKEIIDFSFMRIKDRKDNATGSRYYYDIKNEKIKELEIIPSIKILNKKASMEIDKKNRERNNTFVGKRKLVRKGNEWIVEKEKLDLSNHVLPDSKDLDKNSEDYLKVIKELGKEAKRKGVKMLYPCNKCEKVCQNLSALTLHGRRHDPNPKPFRPRGSQREDKELRQKMVAEAKKTTKNRTAKPKPIVNNHKCDPKLMDFYEKNIKGGDIEFWQFLKIYNRMNKEKVNSFKDLEESTEFGIHFDDKNANLKNNAEVLRNKGTDMNNTTKAKYTNDQSNTATAEKDLSRKVKMISSKKKELPKTLNPRFVRTIRLTKIEYNKRLEVKNRMREKLHDNNDSYSQS